MATLPGSNQSISIQQINAEFGLGNNLNVYKGVRWYKEDGSRGLFPTGTISLADFRSKRATSPAVAGTQTITSSSNVTIPIFNTLTITARSGTGGRGGNNGNLGNGAAGSPGGVTSFGTYTATTTGAGGAAGGGVGSSNTTTFTWTVTDANQATYVALMGSVIPVVIGAGGAGGAGGSSLGYFCTYLGCAWLPYSEPSGAAGAAGSITMTWS